MPLLLVAMPVLLLVLATNSNALVTSSHALVTSSELQRKGVPTSLSNGAFIGSSGCWSL